MERRPSRRLAVVFTAHILFLMDNGLTHMLQEVDDFLMGESKVHRTLSRITRLLDELGIDFALAGGLAVGLRGHLRVTVHVDLLITAEGLKRFKDC